MSAPYGYNNVMMGNQLNQLNSSQSDRLSASGLMMPPPPPPPVNDFGQQQSQQQQQQNLAMQLMSNLQPPPPPPLNPATNDMPLEFNPNCNKAPMPIQDMSGDIDNSGDDRESRRHRDRDRDDSRSRHRDSSRRRSAEQDREESRGRRDRGDRGDRGERRHRDSDGSYGGDAAQGYGAMAQAGAMAMGNGSGNMQAGMGNNMGNMANMGGMGNAMGNMANMGNNMGNAMGAGMNWAGMWPMNQMGQMMMGAMNMMGGGAMGGTMGPDGEMSGEFRITMGMFGYMLSPEGLTVPVKNTLKCKAVTLSPPSRMGPPPTTRDKPLGCRTVFIGGLPENVTEEMVCDVFERCGEITSVRLSKKNFAHIRYELEEFVENAVFLSGYRMRINDSSDSSNTGRLHVDYAQARDDQYDYECRQRAAQREQRRREREQQDALRPPSPPPVPHYTEHEASLVAETLKDANGTREPAFAKAASTLVAWLDRGDCSKRNIGQFYAMIQHTHSHTRRLLSEKMQAEDELAKFREQTKARMQGIVNQFDQIEKVFTASSRQKVWDHFTKAQRRNIDTWKKQSQEMKRVQLDEEDKDEDNEEMDCSDEEPPAKRAKSAASEALKEENDSLRCQLEAYKNEVDMVKADLGGEAKAREQEIQTYKTTLQGMQETLSENVSRRRKDEARISELSAQLRRMQTKLKEVSKEEGGEEKELIFEEAEDAKVEPDLLLEGAVGDDRSAFFIGMMSTFLNIHHKGASVDYLWSYLQQYDNDVTTGQVEALLKKYPTVFKQVTSGVGAKLERKWVFTVRGELS